MTIKHSVAITYLNHGRATAQCGDCEWNCGGRMDLVEGEVKYHENASVALKHRTTIWKNPRDAWNVKCVEDTCEYKRVYVDWVTAIDAGTQHPHRMRYVQA